MGDPFFIALLYKIIKRKEQKYCFKMVIKTKSVVFTENVKRLTNIITKHWKINA